jgi:sugar/nucleoside kinase (ribokinase family)
MKPKTILAFGNPVYDLISTPALRRTDRVLSGCSTNACLAVSKLGEESILVGAVGPDFNERLGRDLDRWRIASRLFPSINTGGFSLLYDERGNRDLTILGVADPIPPGADGFKHADFVLIGPILGETSPELVHHVRQVLSAPILLDPQGLLRVLQNGQVHHRLTPEFGQIAALSTVVKANELETQVITGIDPRQDPEGAVRALYRSGGQIAIVTLAEAGSLIFDGQNIIQIPPYTTHAIDPTGAGDTYAAGFMVKYLETPQDLAAVGCFASAVASVMVENSGPEFPLTRQEADRRTMQLLNGPLRIKLVSSQ